jgi:hypothetical protein
MDSDVAESLRGRIGIFKSLHFQAHVFKAREGLLQEAKAVQVSSFNNDHKLIHFKRILRLRGFRPMATVRGECVALHVNLSK